MAVLREAAQKDCADGVEVKRLPTAVEYTSSCSTNFTGTEPRPTRIDFAKIASIGIVFGDWFQVELHFEDGTDDTENTHLRFSTKEEATRVADALWALRNRKQPG